MFWHIDPAAPAALYEQLAACVRRELADGSLTPGDRLPAARQVAEALEVNLHTVLRAYQVLRDEGLIDLRRGRGAVVAAQSAGRARLQELVAELRAEAGRLGLTTQDLRDLIDKES